MKKSEKFDHLKKFTRRLKTFKKFTNLKKNKVD